MNRFWIAITIYAALGLLAWQTLTAKVEINGRVVPLAWIVYAVLLMFALRTWLHDRRLALENRSEPGARDRTRS